MIGSILIRAETAQDIEQVRRINQLAFGRGGEAELVDQLRENCAGICSLVAIAEGGGVVGHVLFSPVTIETAQGEPLITGMGLGPVAVPPEFQRQGIGTALIRVGLEKIESDRCPFVVVLGHPEYYPRFGFEPASHHGIRCIWDVPDDVFMARIMNAQAMRGVSGVARYRAEFDAV